MAKGKMSRVTIQLPPEDVMAFQILADEMHVSVSQVLREMLRSAMPYIRQSIDMATRLRDSQDDAREAAATVARSVMPHVVMSGNSVGEQLTLALDQITEAVK